MVGSVSASITIPTHVYFGLPNYGTYVNFDETRQFSTVYQTGETVVFDGYVISSQYSNLTVTQFFENDYLILSVSAPTVSTSVITINGASNGYTQKPSVSISPSSIYSDDFTDSNYTLQITHTDPIVCTVHYPSTLFTSDFESLFANTYVALLLYSIIPIIIAAFLVFSALNNTLSKEIVLAALIGLIIYVIVVLATLPIFFALENTM